MVPLCIPDGEEHLAVIKSLLEMAGIRYLVRNEYFGAMVPGAIFAACGPREVLVPADSLERARYLLTPRETGKRRGDNASGFRRLFRKKRRPTLRSV